MTTHQCLIDYALHLTDDIEQAHIIVSNTIREALLMSAALDTADKVNQFLLVTVRNKCCDYNRIGKPVELQAAELNVPVGILQQELRKIREGRFI